MTPTPTRAALAAAFAALSMTTYAARATAGGHGETGPRPQFAALDAPVTGWVMNAKGATIRSGPSFASRRTGSYAGGAKVTGRLVTGGPWFRTSRGYVHRATIESLTCAPRTLNGRMPRSQLCAVPKAWNAPTTFDPGYTPSTQRYLDCDALPELTRLQAAFRAQFGRTASIDLTYRTLAEQRYWWDKLGAGAAAYPGTSNHGYGLAVDVEEKVGGMNGYSWGGAYNRWLVANAPRFGFVNPFAHGTPHESFHFEFRG